MTISLQSCHRWQAVTGAGQLCWSVCRHSGLAGQCQQVRGRCGHIQVCRRWSLEGAQRRWVLKRCRDVADRSIVDLITATRLRAVTAMPGAATLQSAKPRQSYASYWPLRPEGGEDDHRIVFTTFLHIFTGNISNITRLYLTFLRRRRRLILRTVQALIDESACLRARKVTHARGAPSGLAPGTGEAMIDDSLSPRAPLL